MQPYGLPLIRNSATHSLMSSRHEPGAGDPILQSARRMHEGQDHAHKKQHAHANHRTGDLNRHRPRAPRSPARDEAPGDQPPQERTQSRGGFPSPVTTAMPQARRSKPPRRTNAQTIPNKADQRQREATR